ncbi:MAG: Fe-S cluster assembly protein NifU [Planctomycetes bacterium]|nr:Fe-S cluster assembly protein NifU [Planctomycetota bacterium]
MWDYTEKVKDHFLHPRNTGVIKDADAVGEVGNITCGDALKLTLKLDEDERIVDARFQTFGCASAIASSSALTEIIKGKTLAEAAKVTDSDIAEYLDGLPEQKMHCSVMGREALEAAIANYRGEERPPPHEEGEIVCTCFGVTDKVIERAIREHGLKTVDEVTHYCKAGGGCGSCHPQIEEILKQVAGITGGKKARKPERKRPLSNLQRMKLIEEAVEKEIRPLLQQDGGDIELVDVVDHTVLVSLRGSCRGCAMAGFTLAQTVAKKIEEAVGEPIEVKEVEP